ncbi:hypothetical protein AAVH_29177 [Aphelenchoides avenae]|nr:hypothetical protein AAVH_29177 [Aphelenchus avenae]
MEALLGAALEAKDAVVEWVYLWCDHICPRKASGFPADSVHSESSDAESEISAVRKIEKQKSLKKKRGYRKDASSTDVSLEFKSSIEGYDEETQSLPQPKKDTKKTQKSAANRSPKKNGAKTKSASKKSASNKTTKGRRKK